MRLGVVIPTYRAGDSIAKVVSSIPHQVEKIYVIDDQCPDQSYKSLESICDQRLQLIHNEVNLGVGGAVIQGFKAALVDDIDVIIKVDSDGQMDLSYMDDFIHIFKNPEVDFIKGNRFFRLEGLKQMPWLRLLGNSGLSFLSKLSSGYWQMTDPTNGFIALRSRVLREFDFEECLDRRYFFESDLLYQLGLMKANVVEVYMPAIYAGEHSSLSIRHSLYEFLVKNLQRTVKRIFYNYYLRDFNYGSLSLLASLVFIMFGVSWGGVSWFMGAQQGALASSGTVMLAALPIMVGIQFFIFFLQYDISYLARHYKGVKSVLRRSSDMSDIEEVKIHARSS